MDEEESSGGMNFVELFKKELFSTDIGILMGIINIHIEGDFVVQASMKVALGCRFDYTVGQRYNFWVRVKDKDAGSTTTQISDEKYNFEFYVVGILGIKAGVQLEISITLISDKLAAVGLTAEAGVYGKFYGYFYFELHSVNGKKSSDAWGTVYIDFGAYLEIKFKASLFSGVTDKLTYNPTLFEKEWSLLTFGDKYNVLDFYRSKDSVPTLKLKYVTSLDMPTSVFNMKVMDLTTGKVKKMRYNYYDAVSDSTRFSITFDNEAFYYDASDGKIKVRAEDAAANKMLDGNMTVTWLGTGKEISFRANSISITYPVHWDCVPSRYYNIGFTNTPEYTDTISALCGDPVEMPVPVKEGYTFAGWKKSMSDSFVSYTIMPGEDVYLYAMWTPNTDTPYKVLVQLEDANGKFQDYQTYSFTGTTDQKAVVDINDATFAVQDYVPRALPYSMDTTISADGSRVIVLQMARQRFAIVYHMGGATSPVCYCKFGTQVDFVPKTEKTGYTFGGWYSDAELTQRTTVPQIMPAGGIDLYAKWIPKNYTVTYISDNGDVLETRTVAYGTAVGDAYVPAARENAAFRGWYESRFYNGNQYEWDSTFNTLGRNLVLYARWDIEIILDSDGGTECGSIWAPSTNATSVTLPTPVKYNAAAQKNFVFCGWFFTDGDGELTTNEYYRDKLFYVAEGYTLKAKWEPNAVKVTFDASNAIKSAWYRPTVKVITAGETVLTTSEIASGWVFCGWTLDEDNVFFLNRDLDQAELFDFDTVLYNDTTLYAVWKPALKKIQFVVNRATITETSTVSYEGRDAFYDNVYKMYGEVGDTVTLPTPVRVGSDFLGWTTTPDGTDYTTQIEVAGEGDICFYAAWQYQSCVITFETNGGTPILPYTISPGGALSTACATKRYGYEFGGWYTDSELTSEYNGRFPDSDITLYAKWTDVRFTVTFEEDGGSAVPDVYDVVGANITLPTPTKAGYTFLGWYKTATPTRSDKACDTNYYVPGNITLYANWSLDPISVYVELNGGHYTDTAALSWPDPPIFQQRPGAYLLHFDNPRKETYEFEGWYTDAACTIPYDWTVPMQNTEDFTLYAAWGERKYHIYYAVPGPNGGYDVGGYADEILYTATYQPESSELDSVTVNSGDLYVPTKEGYNFAGWYYDSALTNPVGDSVTLTPDNVGTYWDVSVMFLYPKWTEKEFTVHLTGGGGTLNCTTDIQVPYGSPIYQYLPSRESSPASRTGYTFMFWVNPETQNLSSADTMPAHDTTIEAYWWPVWSSIYLDTQTNAASTYYGTPVIDYNYVSTEYDSMLEKPADPKWSNSNFTFGGWYTDSACTAGNEFDWTVPCNITSFTTIYAKWIPTDCLVSFNADNGSSKLMFTVPITKKFTDFYNKTDVPDPTKAGYTFGGWRFKEGSTWYDYSFRHSEISRPSYEIVASWITNEYTISFESNRGSSVSAITQEFNTDLTQPADPTRAGFTFAGWYSDVALTNAYSFTTMPSQNTTVYAKWVAQGGQTTYMVKYYTEDLDGEYVLTSADTLSGNAGAAVTAEQKSLTGFTFNQSASGNVLSGNISDTLELKVYYTRNSYSFSYNTGLANAQTTSTTLKYGAPLSALAALTEDGYEFYGWRDAGGNEYTCDDTMPAVGLYVTEHGDFFEDGLLKRLITAQYDDVGIHSHALKLLYRMLCGL